MLELLQKGVTKNIKDNSVIAGFPATDIKLWKKIINERKMDINKIQEILPHRYPFLLIDRIVDFSDESAHAQMRYYKWAIFSGPFSWRPLMPGVLVVEAIVQTACFTVAIKMKDEMKNPGVFYDYW